MSYIKNPDVSIIICCYNSELRIKSTLEYLACQNLGDLFCELILVDNNCQDNTVKTALSVWKECGNPFNLRIVKEKESGHSHARKTGILVAKAEIILFCDDDNWLARDFIEKGVKIMNSNHEIGVLGGRGIPVFEGEEPNWFSTFQGSYAVGFQALYSGDITRRGYVWGAGCFIRRDTMLRLYSAGFTSFCSGRMGKELTSGDDSEICRWHILIGKNLWYDDSLVFRHFIEKHRLQKEYLTRLIEGFKLSGEYLSLYDEVLFYQKSIKTAKVKFKIKRLMNILYDYKKFSLRYHYQSQINKSLINYFKS